MPNLASIEPQAQPAVALGAKAARLTPMNAPIFNAAPDPLRAIMRSFEFSSSGGPAPRARRARAASRRTRVRPLANPQSTLRNPQS